MPRFAANRLLISIEVLSLIVGALFLAPVLMIGPLGSSEDFTVLSKIGHMAAFVSLLPIALLSIGYLRYPEEFTLAFDGPWIMASISIAIPLGVVVVTILGFNGKGIRLADLLVCMVVIPLVHLIVVGARGRRATQT